MTDESTQATEENAGTHLDMMLHQEIKGTQREDQVSTHQLHRLLVFVYFLVVGELRFWVVGDWGVTQNVLKCPRLVLKFALHRWADWRREQFGGRANDPRVGSSESEISLE